MTIYCDQGFSHFKMFSLFSLLQNTLLQETCEEWEQCERKLKETRVWMDKVQTSLDSPQYRKKPLRDQLGLCEKYLAEVSGQKTKISLSVEKLQVNLPPTQSETRYFDNFSITKHFELPNYSSKLGSLPIGHWW